MRYRVTIIQDGKKFIEKEVEDLQHAEQCVMAYLLANRIIDNTEEYSITITKIK